MLIKSTILAQASGSVNGMVFSHNKGGAYARNRSLVTNPNTDAQQAVRDAQRLILQAWTSTLSPTQRDAWNLYAFNTPMLNRLGDVTKRSGQNMFMRGNLARMQAGEALLTAAPTTFDLGTFTPVSIALAHLTSQVSITFDNTDAWANEDDSFMLIYQSRPQNRTVNFFKGPYQLLTKIAGDAMTPPTSPFTATSLFPTVAAQKVFFKINVARKDGRYSDPQRPECIVT